VTPVTCRHADPSEQDAVHGEGYEDVHAPECVPHPPDPNTRLKGLELTHRFSFEAKR
jgi:hypothetical protein